MPRKRDITVTVVVLLATAALGAAGIAALRQADAKHSAIALHPPQDNAVAVSVAIAQLQAIRFQVAVSGFLEPFEQLTISAPLPGQVETQFVEASDRVNQGDPLFQLDAALHANAVVQARAAAHRARSELEFAVQNLQRIESLQERQAANPTEIAKVNTEHQVARAMLKRADAAVREAEIRLDRTTIRAPLTGHVARVRTRQGEYAHVGQPLVDLIETDRLKLIVQLNDRQVVAFRTGDPVNLRVPVMPRGRFAGRILRIHPRAMPDSRKFEVEIEIPNQEHRLRPGFHVQAEISREPRPDGQPHEAQVVTVPRMAVFELYRRQYTYVVRRADGDAAERAFRTPIETAPLLSDPQHVQVITGLHPGDRVITSGLQHVTDQAPVRVVD